MHITKCDNCKKVIKSYGDEIGVRIEFEHYALCQTCGRSVKTLLKKYNLLLQPKKA